MNDAAGKTSSCLSISEKKNQRPGGCIGIFFQLFDWNRRLAKKRLFFSKKLLPPAGAKQASKKFKGDEKMPNSKLHLVANENNGGFPSAKKGRNRVVADAEQKHEMRVPGLVARLMGLESIPASRRDKSKKASFSTSDNCGCGDGEKESLGSNHSESDYRQGMVDMETGVVRHDTRPQKLQKTGTYERRAVTRFGAEALQIKSVLSRAKKHNQHNHHHQHHLELPSPLKSPRITSGKSASRSSRLIGAATRILEPGLQATSRAKCSLPSSASIYPPKNGIVADEVGTSSAYVQNQSGYDSSTAKSLMGHTSCKNCGNLFDVVKCGTEVKGQPAVAPHVVSDVITANSMVSTQKKGRSFAPSHEQERDIVLLRSQEKLISLVTEEEGKSNAQSCSESTVRRMPFFHEGPAEWNSSRQPCRNLEDEASSFAFKHKTQAQEHMLSSGRISSGSSISNLQAKRVSSAASIMNGTKDFVALNRSLSGQTRMRSPTKVDSSKFDLGRKPCNRQDDSLSEVSSLERKRRTPNVSKVEGTAPFHSVTVKPRNLCSDAQGGRRRDFNSSSLDSSNVRSKQVGQRKTDNVNDNKVNEVVSFTFNSPSKPKIVIPAGKEETSNDNKIKTYFHRPPPLRDDASGALLEQKSKDEELATGVLSKKSTAMILQALISALCSEHLTCPYGHTFNDNVGLHSETKQERLLRTSFNGNHLSPGSVLEASFSSSSLDGSSGLVLHPDSMNCSYDHLEQSEHDSELLDSATSFDKGKIGCKILTDLVNRIPWVFQSLNSFGTRLTKGKLNHMKDVILNAELVLGNTAEHSEDGVPQLLISCFLIDELDTMAGDTMWTDFNGSVGCEGSKGGSLLKVFLFDCVIEYLETNCCQYYNRGFNVWTKWAKLPSCLKAQILAQEVKREIKKWACMVGMVPDEIIEWEMSHSLGKWIDFDIEAFEAGVDIDGEVLQILVDEIVEDLVDCRRGSS